MKRDVAEHRVAVELRRVDDALDLARDLSDLGSDGDLVVVGQGAVVVLDLEVTDALQHRVHLGEGAFRRLDERDAVLRVALRLGETTDLAAHLLRDGEAGGVVRGTVDAIAARELLHGLGGLDARGGQLTMRVERLDVVLNTKAHDSTLLVDRGGWADTRRLPVASNRKIGPEGPIFRHYVDR